MIKILKDVQLINHIFEYDIVLFGMGINNSMGNGFSKELFINFPKLSDSENLTKYGDLNKYGAINETLISGTTFCSCYIYSNTIKKHKDDEYINYDYLEKCLNIISNKYSNKSIAMPIIGQDPFDGNGDKEKIITIIKKVFKNKSDITIFDFKQIDYDLYYYQKMSELRKKFSDKIIDKNEYLKNKGLLKQERKYGIYREK